MRLSTFIAKREEKILSEWDAFAVSLLPAAANLSRTEIRDHAAEMLRAIAKDIATAQTHHEQEEKSKGNAPVVEGATETAAQSHALFRAKGGFDINQMAAEYRALRASVLRLWAAECPPTATTLQDTIRFNEAIDQSLAESIAYFSQELDRSRNLLLGMLGHDMRNPLGVFVLTARYLSQLNAGVAVSKAAALLISSGARLRALLDDLVDFNRTSLGLGIRISPSEFDLRQVFTEQLELLRAAHPGREIEFENSGELVGSWDANRLHQVLGNLVSNALKYGDLQRPVKVALVGNEADVVFSVSNEGHSITPAVMKDMFEPLKRGTGTDLVDSADESLGLGLYITREIIRAHGGKVSADSDSGLTVFRVVLPRENLSAA